MYPCFGYNQGPMFWVLTIIPRTQFPHIQLLVPEVFLTLSGVFPGVNSVTVMMGFGTDAKEVLTFGGMEDASIFFAP